MSKIILLAMFFISSCSSLDKFKPFSCVMKKKDAKRHSMEVVQKTSNLIINEEDSIVIYRNTVFMYSSYLEKEADLAMSLGLYDDAFSYLNMSFNGLVYLIELNEEDKYIEKSLNRVYRKIKAYYTIKLENAIRGKELENKINKIPFNK
jgi:hypothetical protein